MSETLRQKMIDELSSVPNKRMSADRAMICCPYHADRNPSASINLSLTAPAPLGWFRCFGAQCGASHPWNTVATVLGLRKFGKNKRKRADDYVDPKRFKSQLLGEEDEDGNEVAANGFDQEMKEMEFFDFQQDEWREVPVKLLVKVGARLCYLDRTGDFYVWLPVMIEGVLRGYVKACLEKPEEGTSYINAKGAWSTAHGLLFYDYAAALAKRKGIDTVVLVEGPRDALRLLRYGIPAMAVLGAINWSEEKRWTLEQSGINNLILFLDGDDAGLVATRKIYKSVKTHFNVLKVMKLWRDRVPRLNSKGKQKRKKIADGKFKLLWDNERDPGNCDKKYLKQVKELLA